MARIRSVHPGLFTDEIFVSLSAFARLLFIGIWTECDDRGAFEWKPVTLKMRLLPVDNSDVGALLAELRLANAVRYYELDGRQYGAVRNFCKYQRPKKPNYIHPIDDDFPTYVALSHRSSEPVLQKGEIAPQMEDGEKEIKEESEDAAGAASPRKKYEFEHSFIRLTPKDFSKWEKAFSYLDLRAELVALTQWAVEQGPDNWFFALSGALGKRNRDQKFRLEQARQGGPARPLTPSGKPWPDGQI
jgi:hypothetical protein